MYHSVDFLYPFCLKDQASKKSEHTRWHSAATPCSDKLLCVYWRIVVLIFVWVCNRILLLQQVAQFHFWFDFFWLQNSSVSTVQYRKWSPTANDPETANDPQNGPRMILDRMWSPKSTANDPERKVGMTWTEVSGSSCRFYYYSNKSD